MLYPRLEVVVETNLLVVLRTPPGLLQTGFAHEPDVVGRIGSNHSIVIIARGTCGNRVSCTGCIFRVVPSKVRGQDRHWGLAGCVLIKTGAAPRCRMSATPVRRIETGERTCCVKVRLASGLGYCGRGLETLIRNSCVKHCRLSDWVRPGKPPRRLSMSPRSAPDHPDRHELEGRRLNGEQWTEMVSLFVPPETQPSVGRVPQAESQSQTTARNTATRASQ